MINLNFIDLCGKSEFAVEVPQALCKLDFADYHIIATKSNFIDQDYFSVIDKDSYYQVHNPNNIYVAVPVVNQYFHNIVDVLSVIIKLKKSGQNFITLLFSPFEGKQVFEFIYDLKLSYFIEILNYLNIPYETIPDGKKFFEANTYVFLKRPRFLERHSKFQVDPEIHPGNWILDSSYTIDTYLNKKNKPNYGGIIDVYREIFYKPDLLPENKIYISRKDARRRYVDQDDIEEYFRSIGYNIVELSGMSFLDQVKLFNSATHVAGFSGSGLTNIMFCHSGTKILEIRNKENFDPSEFHEFGIYLDLDYNVTNTFSDSPGEILEILKSKKSDSIRRFLS